MTDEKKKPPGVRFEHRGSKIFERGGQKNVEMVIVAQVNDEEVWKEVEKKFIEGFDVYAHDDIKEEIRRALAMTVIELEEKVRILELENSRLNKETALLEEKIETVQRPIRELGQRLARR